MRDRLRRRRPGCDGRGRRHRGPHDRRPARSPARTPLSIATGLDMETPDAGQRAAVDRPLGPGPRHAACRCSASCCCSASAPAILGGRRRRPVAGEAAGLPGPLRAAGRASARRRRSTSTARSVDRETYVATLMYAAEKEAIDLTRDGDTWTIKDKQRPGRAGPGSTRSPRHRAHPRRPGRDVHGQQEGRRGRPAAARRDRAVRQQRRDLGRRPRATWSPAGSAAWAACWSWPASPACSSSRSGTPSR